MGIPRYFVWLLENFRNNVHPVYDKSKLPPHHKIEVLLLDMNCLIHPALKAVLDKLSMQVIRRDASTPSIETLAFRELTNMVERLIMLIRPSKVIMCIDGPAPRSKQNQQRQRRFRASMERKDGGFDTNCITPGTSFMQNLSTYLDNYVQRVMREKKPFCWMYVEEVVLSTASTPGEGEHKLMNYVRHNPGLSYCLYGADADLLMLGMAVKEYASHFYVLREETFARHAYNFVDVSALHDQVADRLNWTKGVVNAESEPYPAFYPKLAIQDFILMCFFVGNDFLPHVPGIEIMIGSIDLMIELYVQCGRTHGHLTKPDASLHLSAFIRFLRLIAEKEVDSFVKKMEQKDRLFPMPLLCEASKRCGSSFTVDLPAYKTAYYKEYFEDETEVSSICKEYIDGLCWVLRYYTEDTPPSWGWCYPFHYAPFISDVADFLSQTKPMSGQTLAVKEGLTVPWKTLSLAERRAYTARANEIRVLAYSKPKFDRGEPTLPFVQLLSVLPPKSAHLLPEPYARLFQTVLKPYCPDVLKIDLAGCLKEWEGKTILPFIDYAMVSRASSLVDASSVSAFDMSRNKLTSSILYTSTTRVARDI